ncbi:MaoC family dehydratase [soil metagenome]
MKENDHFQQEFTVSKKIYDLFIEAFEDRNPLHTETEFAKSKSFEGKVMHGAILVGFLSKFIGECLPVKNVIVQSYTIHFAKPVYMNRKLLFEAVVSGIYESVNSAEFKYTFKNETDTVAKGKVNISLI